MKNGPEVKVIVLNYNGKSLLEECLPSLECAAQKSRYPCRVVVLDNQSVDDSERFVKERFKGVEFVKSPANKVLCSYNDYLRTISDEIVVLLNNDIRVEADFLDSLVGLLDSRPDAFFTAPQILGHQTKRYESGRAKLDFRWGLPWGNSFFEGSDEKINKSGVTMQCGFGAFRRGPFLELGGYDDLYLPGTVEDADLCFRAYRKGWKGYYCPESRVYHIGQVSFKRAFGVSGIRRINRRNLYLFVWKNIQSPVLLLKHFLCLPLHLVKDALSGRWDFLLGFFDAWRRLPEALSRRRAEIRKGYPLTDREVFKISGSI